MAARSVLLGAALPTHDAIILGAEGLFGQRLVTLCTAETLLVPEPALMAELLMEEGGMEESLTTGMWREHGPDDKYMMIDAPLIPQGWVDDTRRSCWRRTWCGSGRTPACLRCGRTSFPRGPPDSRNSVSCRPSSLRGRLRAAADEARREGKGNDENSADSWWQVRFIRVVWSIKYQAACLCFT